MDGEFGRVCVYGDEKGYYQDNIERCVFFARGVIETIRKLRWKPDVVYCQGWFAAIAPVYIKKSFGEDPCFRGCKVVYDLFGNVFKSPLQNNFYSTVKREGVLKADLIETKDKAVDFTMLSRLAVKFSDGLIISDNTPEAAAIREYAESRNLPIMDATSEELDIAQYDAFFEQFNSKAAAPEDRTSNPSL